MNTHLLTQTLTDFDRWMTTHPQAVVEQEDRETSAAQTRSYTKERLLALTEEELYDYLSPLWAMLMWGNKHYQIDNIIASNGMPLLRKHLANLIYGEDSIEKRWDEFREKIKGIGPAMMSELLCKTHPEQYLLWNRKTHNGFTLLQITGIPRYESSLTGKTYAHLSAQGRDILAFAKQHGNRIIRDMLTLNTFIWHDLQQAPEIETAQAKHPEKLPATAKESAFIHNDIRDKLADIGRFLGFRAEIEKKVAAGAVVDTAWEATIGNMGRIIYVFEVQTSGSIDSLIMNLMKASGNNAVQGIVAVSDSRQIEKIKRETAALRDIRERLICWDYTEVLKVHESLQYINETINTLGLVPQGL
ncbi:hypothetical protein [Akkermansia glycaniphila]|uniref:Uncharacterized protein n=1 Tax=Akkermansia glycaniphila TaxID=1679444 RepID=A0A1C7PE26_9BACT|nr:hypothetical protein [Akkermansia glycaniphila]OCA03797.1 hypothetical protein AC781_02665 [Akkermansia glycaniphila]SEH81946.1 Hypothetical protein PYTT_0979 [Akkermansia glycaniphila]